MKTMPIYAGNLLLFVFCTQCQQAKEEEPAPAPLPKAEFQIQGALARNKPVSFINSSQHAQTYLWDFADGKTSTEVNPEHSFQKAGTYHVKLTATGPGGQAEAQQSATIVVTPNDVLGTYMCTVYTSFNPTTSQEKVVVYRVGTNGISFAGNNYHEISNTPDQYRFWTDIYLASTNGSVTYFAQNDSISGSFYSGGIAYGFTKFYQGKKI